ncbi:MAG: type IV pili twitching motility protein PilT, partial [Thermodesulfobacteriota bacterium]
MSDTVSPIDDILKKAVAEGASDVHIKAGLPPILRINGVLAPIKNYERISPDEALKMATSIMREEHKEEFKRKRQVDIGYSMPGTGRFRVNVFQQRGAIGIVL